MKRELYIQKEGGESLIAIFEGDTLIECRIETEQFSSSIGNIYKGKVRRIVPEMNAAFIDIGLDKPALLDARDIGQRKNTEKEPLVIEDLVKEGAVIWVQAIKDQVLSKQGLADKGTRVSTQLNIETPYFVYFTEGQHVGASKKVDDIIVRDQRVAELREWMKQQKKKGGMIIRTAAFDLPEEQYLIELDKIIKKSDDLLTAKKNALKIGLVYQAMNFMDKAMNDYSGSSLDVISSDACVKSAFSEKRFYSQVNLALTPLVELVGGASIVIEATEALISIDVNTGSAIEKGLSIFDVNLEALNETARQIKLRGLAGAIFVDFINMNSAKEKKKLLNAAHKIFHVKQSSVTVHGMTKLFLMELSAKRTSISLPEMSHFSTLLFASEH